MAAIWPRPSHRATTFRRSTLDRAALDDGQAGVITPRTDGTDGNPCDSEHTSPMVRLHERERASVRPGARPSMPSYPGRRRSTPPQPHLDDGQAGVITPRTDGTDGNPCDSEHTSPMVRLHERERASVRLGARPSMPALSRSETKHATAAAPRRRSRGDHTAHRWHQWQTSCDNEHTSPIVRLYERERASDRPDAGRPSPGRRRSTPPQPHLDDGQAGVITPRTDGTDGNPMRQRAHLGHTNANAPASPWAHARPCRPSPARRRSTPPQPHLARSTDDDTTPSASDPPTAHVPEAPPTRPPPSAVKAPESPSPRDPCHTSPQRMRRAHALPSRKATDANAFGTRGTRRLAPGRITRPLTSPQRR